MTSARSHPTKLSVTDRLEIRDLLMAWNWAVDAGDAVALSALCEPDIHIDDNGTEHIGIDSFLRAQLALGAGMQRWTDHPRLVREGDGIVVTSMAMITVQFSTGGTGLVWSGHSRDLLQRTTSWKFVNRILRPWRGDILGRFPHYVPKPSGSMG